MLVPPKLAVRRSLWTGVIVQALIGHLLVYQSNPLVLVVGLLDQDYIYLESANDTVITDCFGFHAGAGVWFYRTT